ncbi:MAG: alpha/beta hydrolase, partial [Chloroflexota bacterium]|nr:alpha/beta hydrolase [Chloroflexota bacterium]
DVEELADALGIERFAVVGTSGGGPYAAACAYKIPEQLTTVALIGSVAPLDAPEVRAMLQGRYHRYLPIARRASWLLRLPLALRAWRVRRDPERFLPEWVAPMPEPDRRTLLSAEGIGLLLLEDFVEAFRRDARGVAYEASLYTNPWGFPLEAITKEVYLWHGMADAHMPVAMGQYLARTLPNCHATFYPGEGHFSVIFNHMDKLVDLLNCDGVGM